MHFKTLLFTLNRNKTELQDVRQVMQGERIIWRDIADSIEAGYKIYSKLKKVRHI